MKISMTTKKDSVKTNRPLTILYFGTYEESYSRNQIMIKSLKKMGHSIKECHVSLWRNQIDKTKTVTGIFGKFFFIARLLSIYPLLFFKYLFVGHYDVMFVGYFGHLDMLFAKLFQTIAFREKSIVFDAFISLFDSMVTDRKMLKDGSFFSRLVFWLDKIACRSADIVILDTNAHIDFFHHTFGVPKEKMVRIFACADTDVFYPRQVEKKDATFNALFMGKYTPLHGIKYIVEAAEILKNDENIRFTFIGKGQLYPEIRSLVKQMELRNITFIDWVPYETLPDYIAAADVCLGIFSLSEKALRVIPNKVFQSLAMKKAVITENSKASCELLANEENALLCNPGSGRGIAEAILKLKVNPSLRCKIEEHGYRSFGERCGLRTVEANLADLLDSDNGNS
jgi:glycosyltransferase involved in cell wall biosynthesis